MSLTSILSKIGDAEIQVQSLVSDMTAGHVGKKGATITFATNPAYVSDLNQCAVLGGTPEKLGLVVWVDADKWDAARQA